MDLVDIQSVGIYSTRDMSSVKNIKVDHGISVQKLTGGKNPIIIEKQEIRR
jgi:hypothetical protein